MKYYSNVIQILLIFLIFWVFWTPGIKVATDFHTSTAVDLASNIYPFIWKDTIAAVGLGEYTVNVLWSQPFHALFGILSLTNIPFEIVEKFLGILCILVAFFSIKKLLSFFGVRVWGKIVGAFFYLTNTFFVLLFDGGQLPLVLGYGVLPLMVLYFLKGSIWFTFWLVVLSILDIRLIYIVGIIIITFLVYSFLFARSTTNFKKLLINIMISPIVLIGIHAFWLLPSFISRPPQLPTTYERISQVDFLSFSTILHSLLMQQPHWYMNVFGKISSPQVWFIGIPILALVIILSKKRDITVGFWMLIALMGVFLSKGSQEPLGGIYSLLFVYIPGFSLFRDPVKFYFLVALAYTILISLSIDQIAKFSGKNSLLSRVIKWSPILVIIYLLYLVRPVFLGQMTGMLSSPIHQSEYSQFRESLLETNNESIVLWIPTKAPLGFSDKDYPSIDALRLAQKRPFAVGAKGSYETLNFLREASYMGEIFDVSGIGYIVYPFLDSRRDDTHPDSINYYYLFLDQLSNLAWLSRIDSSPIPLLETKTHQNKFFIAPNVWWVIGSDNLYNESTKSASLKLSRNAMIFAEELAGLGQRINDVPQAKIVLNNKTILDLAATFIEPTNLIFLAKKLDFEPNESGWWKREAADLSRWREFLVNKYNIDNQDFDLGGGWAVGEGEKQYQISNIKYQNGNILLARVMESSRSGSLSFYQGEQLTGKIETKVNKDANVRWFEVGEYQKNGEQLTISSSGDINVVNALAVIAKDEWLNYKEKAKGLEGRVIDFNNVKTTNSSFPQVTYKKVNPTKYLVNISGLTQEAFLVFSQNYDGLWKMSGRAALPVYSLLNGFKIEKDGEYIVEFEAQKYVSYGLFVSGLTVVCLIFLLIRYRKER